MTRKTRWLCGFAGLALEGGILFAAGMLHRHVPLPFMDFPFVEWALFIFFLSIALLEIPVMIVAIRRLAQGSGERWPLLTFILPILFVAFPGAYAAMFLLLAGWLIGAMIIAASSVLRFALLVAFTYT